MNNKIIEAALRVFTECKVESFPIPCDAILTHYGYRIYKYYELMQKNAELYDMCINYSEDAFHHRGSMIIAYNTHKPAGRIRFSLMHELGHHMLNHKSDSRQNEQEANAFASNILAPRIAIYYADCKNAADVGKIFGLTMEASQYAFDDFRRWRRQVHTHKQALTPGEWGIYRHFYNAQKKQFVWSKKKCMKCQRTIYNAKDPLCDSCKLKNSKLYNPYIPAALPSAYENPLFEEMNRQFRSAENYYLYGHNL